MQAGDRILIPAGRYTESFTWNKAVSLIGANATTTIIHALANQRALTVTGASVNAAVVISGLTFTGGYLDGHLTCPIDCGAGILITDTASPLLVSIIITGDYSDWVASGLYAEPGGTLNLVDVKVLSNSAYANLARGAYISGSVNIIDSHFVSNVGGGLSVVGSAILTGTEFDAHVVNAVFARNAARLAGSALYENSPGIDAILHATIADIGLNTKQAISVLTGTVGITDTIITNQAVAIDQMADAVVYQDYNVFFGNTLTQTGVVVDGGHSLSGDPHFANPRIDNYQILSPSAAIDVEVNAGVFSDLTGLPRPLGTGFDIGAYEYPDFPNHVYLPLIVKNR